MISSYAACLHHEDGSLVLLGYLTNSDNESTLKIALLALMVVAAFGLRLLVNWARTESREPDPWGEQVSDAMESEEAAPLCHRCLMPHGALVNFCPKCGAPVGQYTNLLPYPYLFSMGHTFRLGAAGEYRRSPLTIIGFVLFAIVEYGVFVPIYWFRLLLGLSQKPDTDSSAPPVSAEPQPTVAPSGDGGY